MGLPSLKRRAFRAVRQVCGIEICPKVQAAEALGADMECVSATAHQMRHALASLLVMATSSPGRCPNCAALLPAHVDACSVGRLLRLTCDDPDGQGEFGDRPEA